MDARIEGQLSGVVHTIPTRDNGSAAESRAQTPAAVKRAANAGTPAAPAQLFDANGDGAIESWSFAQGGDSYTTFKPPPSGAVGSNLRRVNHARPTAPVTPQATHRTDKQTSTAAAIHHAREAYQRDGAAAGSDPRPPSTPAPAPATTGTSASSTPAPQVTQLAGAPPLPSNRS